VGLGEELTWKEWREAFRILHDVGVNFNLILGNETWLLGGSLLDIMKENKVPYALYTTCPEPIFSIHRRSFFDSGVIDNLSCGVDYPPLSNPVKDDSYEKSMSALKGFNWVKREYPHVDTQGTITVHKKNLEYVPKLVHLLSTMGVFVGINFIHWNKDGKYDFFPREEEIKDLLFTDEDYEKIKYYLGEALDDDTHLIQNPEFISEDVKMLTSMGWHCKGNPYGGPTIDSDGHLRCCGYRRGKHTPIMTIFDLPGNEDAWEELVYQDAMECPGCAWSYPWMFHYWEKTNPSMGKKVFVKHAGEHISKHKWSNRKIE
jgi:hypothetical protein